MAYALFLGCIYPDGHAVNRDPPAIHLFVSIHGERSAGRCVPPRPMPEVKRCARRVGHGDDIDAGDCLVNREDWSGR